MPLVSEGNDNILDCEKNLRTQKNKNVFVTVSESYEEVTKFNMPMRTSVQNSCQEPYSQYPKTENHPNVHPQNNG